MNAKLALAGILLAAAGCGGGDAPMPAATAEAASKATASADDAFFAGKLAEALPLLEAAIAKPGVAADALGDLHAKLAACKAAAGDAPGAKEALDKAEQASYAGPIAAYADGHLKLKAGDAAGAKKAFALAKKNDPRLTLPPEFK